MKPVTSWAGAIPQQGWRMVFEIREVMSAIGEVMHVAETDGKISVWVELDTDFTHTMGRQSAHVSWRRAIPPPVPT